MKSLEVERGPSLSEMSDSWPRTVSVRGLFLLLGFFGWQHEGGHTIVTGQESYQPPVAEKSNEGELAIHRFQIPKGMSAKLFAAEPLVANPVAMCFDERGRLFVAETFRQLHGVEDNRNHSEWLMDDLAAKTVNDRIAYFQKHLKQAADKYRLHHDRVRRLEDTNSDGVVDKSTVFVDGFNAIEEGTGAGLLALNGSVYYTCIPKLWLFQDENDDGQADKGTRKILHDGFGVRVAFRGHDLHGLILGPDGRIYFSIGDRGYHVQTKNGLLAQPDRGAVFRCERDGSNLEVFASGLRNPQELAFDDFGNLFTCDNNSDGGDKARWTYLPEGADCGWRMYFQYLPDRGPWNRERLWFPSHPGQATYIVPPIANFADGPSGLAYYPGTGLPEKYRSHFFLADFRGSAVNSGIRTFSLIPRGASFDLVDPEQFVWSILATDVEFGPDGGVYVSDWVDGWNGTGKGRVYRFRDDSSADAPAAKEVAELLKKGFDNRPVRELGNLLAHPDSRIRQRAQLALVDGIATKELNRVATTGDSLFARIHAIWGLGHLARSKPDVLQAVLPLMEDPVEEVRVQAARVCGDNRWEPANPALVKLLADASPRVKSIAAIAVGRTKATAAVERLFKILSDNTDGDATLRHAAIMGLVGTADPKLLAAAKGRPSAAERLGAVVALRRLRGPGLSEFLNDADPLVVLEAARAIHDEGLDAAMPALAGMIEQKGLPDPLLRRVLNAAFRLGSRERAVQVARFAADPTQPLVNRLQALADLYDWNTPPPLDRVTNEHRPLTERKQDIAEVLRPLLGSLLGSAPAVSESASKLAARYGIKDVEPQLVEVASNAGRGGADRVAAFQALAVLKSERLPKLVDSALLDADRQVRSVARQLLINIDPARAIETLAETQILGALEEQQSAVASLASMKRAEADTVLEKWFDAMLEGNVPEAVHLELIEAAAARGTDGLKERVAKYNAARKPDDPLRDYRESLVGGNAVRGRTIFFSRSEASCRRCHRLDNDGSEVGPDLSRIGIEKTREYLLESLIDPNKQIAKGFETTILQMSDGKVYAGIIKGDDGTRLQVQQPDGVLVTVEKSKIEDRAVGKSGMPEDLIKKLSKSEVRDLVEYLTTLQAPAPLPELKK